MDRAHGPHSGLLAALGEPTLKAVVAVQPRAGARGAWAVGGRSNLLTFIHVRFDYPFPPFTSLFQLKI